MESKNNRKPYFMFFPDIWLGDLELGCCTLQTQGAWVKLLCYMHKATPYGHLIVNGKKLDEKGIKKLLKVDDETFNKIWAELWGNGVIKKDKVTDTYCSKRMIRDYEKFLKKDEVSDKHRKFAEVIVNYLNKQANKKYDIKDESYVLIISNKLKNGHAPEDFKKVIDVKCEEWLEDTKMNVYLRPDTLFKDGKFEQYLKQSKQDVSFSGNTSNKK